MRRLLAQTALWTSAYLAAPVLALLVALAGSPPPTRGLLTEFGVALGFVALAMLAAQFALTARFRRIAPSIGIDAMMQFHRQAGVAATLFALAHPLVLFIADPAYLAFLNPLDQFPRAAALITVTVALVAITASTLWRTNLGLSYERWRTAHAALAFLIVFIGLVHALRVSHYVSTLGARAFFVALVGFAVYLLVYARFIKPALLRSRPYRVAEVRTESERVWTLALEPVVGHEAMRFKAGQFAWLTLGASPFSVRQHPFSFSSSAETRGRVEFTIKALGDFTARIGDVAPGTTAFVEGPYGAFTIDEHAPGFVFIVGGVGVTPAMSILRTLRDRADPRPATVILGASCAEKLIFRRELERLRDEGRIRLVFALEEPSDDCPCERGVITPELLDRHLTPDDVAARTFYVCGPEPMMDATERALHARAVPISRVRSERFTMA